LKDTAGPALNPMIKVVNLVSLIAAPIIVATKPSDPLVWVVAALLLAALIWAIFTSNKPVKELIAETPVIGEVEKKPE